MEVYFLPRVARLICLTFALKGDALDEYMARFRDRMKCGEFRSASHALKELDRTLETSEFRNYSRA